VGRALERRRRVGAVLPPGAGRGDCRGLAGALRHPALEARASRKAPVDPSYERSEPVLHFSPSTFYTVDGNKDPIGGEGGYCDDPPQLELGCIRLGYAMADVLRRIGVDERRARRRAFW
jgi:hypothetical protein